LSSAGLLDVFCLPLSFLLSTDETKVCYLNLYSVANKPTYLPLWQILNMRDICGDLQRLGLIFWKLLYLNYNRKLIHKSDEVNRDFGQSLPNFNKIIRVSDEKPKYNFLFKN
jgi:hypothetical protein